MTASKAEQVNTCDLTEDERDVWKAAFGATMAAALADRCEGFSILVAREEAAIVADEVVASLSGLGGLPIEVSP